MSSRESQTQYIERPSPLTASGSRKAFGAVAYTLFILLTGTNLPTPLYRGYERTFAYSPLVTTLIFAVYVAALVPALLIAGPLSDAIGRRRVLLPSLILAVAGSLAFAVANGVFWLFAARILQGLAVGAASGALTAALSEFEPTGNRHRAALVATAVSLGGLGAGPLVAGLLAQYGPAPYMVPFWVEIILLIPAMMLVASLPEKGARTKWRPRRPSIPPVMRYAFATSGSANFLAFSVIGLFLSLVPAYVVKLSAINNLAIAGGTVTLMLGCSVVAQMIGYGRSPLRLQIGGLALLAVGLTLLAVAGQLSSLPLMIVASVVAGVGHGMTFLGGLTEINRLAPPDRHAETVSSFYVIVYLGVGVPVIGVGLLSKIVGSLAAVQIFTAFVVPLSLIALALIAMSRRRLEKAPDASGQLQEHKV